MTKPKIAGMGLNWQHCADMAYCSPTPVWVLLPGPAADLPLPAGPASHRHVVIAETEENVIAAVDRKATAAPHAARAGSRRDAPSACAR